MIEKRGNVANAQLQYDGERRVAPKSRVGPYGQRGPAPSQGLASSARAATFISNHHLLLRTMSTAALPPTPKSPSVGLRRKGPKSLPTLPLSAFTPPNTGTSDKFPLPPSPSTLQPEEIVDAHVISATADLSSWQSEAGQNLGGRIRGVVLSLHGAQPADVEKLVKE